MTQLAPARFAEVWGRLRGEIGRVIVGNDEIVDGVLTCLFAGGHGLLEGVPGLGKTLLVRTLAAALHATFTRIQFTPDLMPTDITGTMIVAEDEGRRDFRFQPGPVFANVVLADEINRATPKTQSALLEAMAEGTVSIAGKNHALPQPFVVLGTQNPIEMEGTYPLPEAQLDRFLLKMVLPFPAIEELAEIVDRTTGTAVPSAEPVVTTLEVQELKQLVRAVPAAGPVKEFALRLVMALHPEGKLATDSVKRYVRYGPSPRGAQALVLCSKLRALSQGRTNVAFADVRATAVATLRHRVLLSFEGEAAGLSTDRVIAEVLAALQELPSELEREVARS